MKTTLLFLFFFTANLVISAQQNKHTVRTDETLYQLSKKYNISIEHIKGANPFLLNRGLQIDDILTIPTPSDIISNSYLQEHLKQNSNVYRSKSDTLYSINEKYNISATKIKSPNNILGKN